MKEFWKNHKKNAWKMGIAGMLIAALVGLTGLSSGQEPGLQVLTPLHLSAYSPKYECIEYFDDPTYVDYVAVETEINVHNPNPVGVEVMTKLLELDFIPTDPSTPGGPTVASSVFLPPDWGFNIDCGDITMAEFACVGAPPPTQEGFVIIETLLPLDIVVLYDKDQGSRDFQTGTIETGGVDFEYERVQPTITAGPFSPAGCPWP